MAYNDFEPITLTINISYKGEIIASESSISNDELFGLREGAYNLEEQLKKLGVTAIKNAYKHKTVQETIKNRNA